MSELKQVYVLDGKIFDTKAEAEDYIRLPKVRAALVVLTKNNKELSDWLIENQESVEQAFDTGTIKRVTKSEKNKLGKALVALGETTEPKLAFLRDNADAILESFRWPSVKRMTDEEKAVAARNTLVAASEGNTDLAEWVMANKDGILEAYAAGKVKREINPKAAEALAAYRAKKAAEKAAAAK